jgi:hypothetical protein
MHATRKNLSLDGGQVGCGARGTGLARAHDLIFAPASSSSSLIISITIDRACCKHKHPESKQAQKKKKEE